MDGWMDGWEVGERGGGCGGSEVLVRSEVRTMVVGSE